MTDWFEVAKDITQPVDRISERVPRGEWRWFGNAGHLIVGQYCRFHLCTQVGPWRVSTVGEYVHPRHSGGSERTEAEWLKENHPGEEVGCGRKYETMVFPTDDTNCSCGCGMPNVADWSGVDSDGYNDGATATAGHYAMCEKYAALTTEAP
jgi:hypothetical protein